jgi:hypothetical protein
MPIRVPEDLIALSRYRTIQLAELTYLEYSQSSLVKEVEVQMTQNSLLLPLAGEKVLHHGGEAISGKTRNRSLPTFRGLRDF